MKIPFPEIFADETKNGTKLKTSDYQTSGTYPIIDQGQDFIAGYTDSENGLYTDVPAIIFGDHTRVLKYVDFPFFLGADGAKILKARKAHANYRYLYYALKSVRIPDTGYNRHFKWLKEAPVTIPDSQKQESIVFTLDSISRIISHRKSQLAKLDELVKCRFVELFGDPVANPKNWPKQDLASYIDFMTSGSRGWSKFFSNNGKYFITIKNVKGGKVSTASVQYVNPPNNAEAIRTKLKEGDLLISITADLGRTGVVSKEIADYGAYINQHLACVRLKPEILHPLYTAYFLETEAGKLQFSSKNQNAVKAGLNFDSIKSLQILVPPRPKQETFVTFVSRIDKLRFFVWLV